MNIKSLPWRPALLLGWPSSFPRKAYRLSLAFTVILGGAFLAAPAARAQAAASDTETPAKDTTPPRSETETQDPATTPPRSETAFPNYPAGKRQIARAFFNVAQLYDGNVYGFGAVGRPVADTFTNFSPRIAWERYSRTTQWASSYGAEMRRYARFSNLNTVTHDGSLDFQYQNSAYFKWGFSERFMLVPDAALLPVRAMTRNDDRFDPSLGSAPISQPATGPAEDPRSNRPESPLVTGRSRRFYNRSALMGQYTFNPRSIVNVEGAFEQLHFSRADLVSHNNLSMKTSFAHQQTARRSFTLAYQFTHFAFGSKTGPVNNHQFMAGLSARLTRTVSGDVQAGPSLASSGQQRFTAWGARVGLEKQFAHMRLRTGYARFVGTAGGLSGATRNQSYLAALTADIGRRTALELAATYTNYQTLFSRDFNLHGFFWSASLESALTRYVRWFLTYQRINQSRTALLGSAVDYDRMAVGLRILAPLSNH